MLGELAVAAAADGEGFPDIANASRPMKKSEFDACAAKGVKELTYHRDREDRCSGAFAAAYDAYEQGTVTLTQRRTDGRLHYLATRRTSRG